MASIIDFVQRQALLDVTFDQLAAGATIESPKTGSKTVGTSIVGITSNTIISTSLPRTLRGDAYLVGVIPPVAADGSNIDFEFYFKADDQSLEAYQLFDGSLDANMAPMPYATMGGPVDRNGNEIGWFILGKSARSILADAVAGKPTNNMPLEITGIKFEDSLTVVGRSQTGWGATRLVPARIIVLGELLTEDIVNLIMAGYNGYVYKQFMQRQLEGKSPLSFTHQGVASFDGWTSLPGGVKQRGMRVHRFLRFAKNAAQTGAQEAFPLTTLPELKGSDTNVADSNHDLGFNTAKTGDALWVKGFGVRPGANQAYFGWQIDGSLMPNPYGWPVTRTVNPYNFGSVQPLQPFSNLYHLIPRYHGELLIYGEGAVPFIKANGSAIAQNDAEVVVDGVIVEKVA